MRIVVAAFLCACSPAQPQTVEIPAAQPAEAGVVEAGLAQPKPQPQSANPACPPSYSGGPQPTCKPGDDPGPCGYPEGTCRCGRPPICGGAMPRPMPPTWVCEAPRTPCPAPGTPCQGKATCHDGACSWQGVVRCENGVWSAVRINPPP